MRLEDERSIAHVSRFVGVGRYEHTKPASAQWPQFGRVPSHRDLRRRHLSQAWLVFALEVAIRWTHNVGKYLETQP